MRRSGRILGLVALACVALGRPALARPGTPPVLVALSPAEDARTTIAVGPAGELYEPDGAGAWIRTRPVATASTVERVARVGSMVVALAEGTVFRLAPSGWSALRLVRKGAAVLSPGRHTVAAVGRQLFALDHLVEGAPRKLARAPHPVTAIGSGPRATVIATARGLFRLDRTRFVPLTKVHAPMAAQVDALISDRWALTARGALELRSGKLTPWPAGVTIHAATSGPGESLVVIATTPAGLELLTLSGTRPALARAPVPIAGALPVALVVDAAGRVVVALRDGRLGMRLDGAWTEHRVVEPPRDPRPGSPPALSP